MKGKKNVVGITWNSTGTCAFVSLYDCHCRQVAESSPNPSLVMITPHNFDPRLVFHRFISGYREKLSKTAIKHSLLEFTFYQVFGTFGFFLPQCSRYSCSPPRRPSCKWLTVLNSWHSRELGYTTPCRKANKKVCFCPSEKGSKKVQKKNPLFCPRFQNYRAPLILGLAANGQLFWTCGIPVS